MLSGGSVHPMTKGSSYNKKVICWIKTKKRNKKEGKDSQENREGKKMLKRLVRLFFLGLFFPEDSQAFQLEAV